jgi:glutamyl-tRNA reductase
LPEPDGAGIPVCVGTSHRVAPLAFIERALAGAERYRRAWQESPKDATSAPVPIRELVLLATCNRVEIWAAVRYDHADLAIDGIRTAIADGDAATGRVYALRDGDALRHLCRVAGGLDSMVIGEPQIAGQVSRAFESVLRANGGAPVLGLAARTAKLASRRARTETRIGRGAASLSTVAVHAAAQRPGGLAGARVLVVGAGKIGRLACQSLRDRGADLAIVNRTLARAEAVAARVGAVPLPLDALGSSIAESDVVIASTASPRPIIDATLLRSAFAARSDDRPLTLIDIAVPRNVAADVAALPGVTLLDIDDLRRRVRSHLAERRREIPRAESIIDEVLRERFDETAPGTIGDRRRRALEQDPPRTGTSP